jgi:hypothetical protein
MRGVVNEKRSSYYSVFIGCIRGERKKTASNEEAVNASMLGEKNTQLTTSSYYSSKRGVPIN